MASTFRTPADYDRLTAVEVVAALPGLGADGLIRVEARERSGKNRTTVLRRIAELQVSSALRPKENSSQAADGVPGMAGVTTSQTAPKPASASTTASDKAWFEMGNPGLDDGDGEDLPGVLPKNGEVSSDRPDDAFGIALQVAFVFKILAVLTVIGGVIIGINIADLGGSDYPDESGDVTAYLATIAVATVTTASILAFFGFVLEILVGTYDHIRHIRYKEEDE